MIATTDSDETANRVRLQLDHIVRLTSISRHSSILVKNSLQGQASWRKQDNDWRTRKVLPLEMGEQL